MENFLRCRDWQNIHIWLTWFPLLLLNYTNWTHFDAIHIVANVFLIYFEAIHSFLSYSKAGGRDEGVLPLASPGLKYSGMFDLIGEVGQLTSHILETYFVIVVVVFNF